MKKVYFLAGSAIFFWSTMATISKLLLGSFTSIQVLCISSLFAFLFLFIKNLVTRNIVKLKYYKAKDILIMILIGLPGVLVYNLLYYIGAARMPASQAFIINYLWPIMSVIFACILLKEKLDFRKIIAIVLSFIGVIIVAGSNLTGFDSSMIIGAVSIFFAAVSYGLFTGLNQKFKFDKNISVMLVYGATFLITVVMAIFEKQPISLDAFSVFGLAWNGALVMGLATTAWAIALESGNTAKISNLAYITPFASLVWISLLLKEKISVLSIVGLVVIVGGILIQLKKEKNG